MTRTQRRRPGTNRAAAINAARVGAQKIWAGTVSIHANAKTGAHHHGALESVIYVVRGKAACAGPSTGNRTAVWRTAGDGVKGVLTDQLATMGGVGRVQQAFDRYCNMVRVRDVA